MIAKWLNWRSRVLLPLIVLIYVAATVLSMRQTSTTFDEILLPSSGARGYTTGNFNLIQYFHPRLTQYLYGLPVLLSRPTYPSEAREWGPRGTSFTYARELYFGHDNDGRQLAFRARLIAVAFGVGLILLVYAFVRRYYGGVPALLAAGMTAFLPDLIAHGGISYNDVPNALAFFAAVWSLDRAAAHPTLKTVGVGALVTALALGTKYSAVALAPIAVVLMGLETVARGKEWQPYLRRMLPLIPLALLGVYLAVVAIYLGDFTLASFRKGLVFNIIHASEGHGVPAWILGREDQKGFWFFFPVAFLIKTPAALHVLLVIALLGLSVSNRNMRELLRSPLRGPLVGGVVFMIFLLRSDLNIGFRHAMPMLPCLIVMAAVGLGRVWQTRGRIVRLTIAGLVIVQAATVLSWYPHFIPYTSEYFPQRDLGLTRLTDSSLDWGQGLPLVREFMTEEGVSVIYLSYFGSAPAIAYGVDYVPLPSFFPLDPRPAPAEPPRFVAISATNLVGTYISDALSSFRQAEPYRILGHSIFIYRVDH
jgi:4-amino-4-deoxy-L-arabinose transferase-like glycosyltransferase